MFGRGIEIQGDSSAMREEGYIMLLQLTYDDLMHWGFGDNGVLSILDITGRSRQAELGSREDDVRMSLSMPPASRKANAR